MRGEDRRAAVCRELTKTFEEVRRGGLGELANWARDGVRGEVSVVIEGATQAAADVNLLVPAVEDLVAAGERLKTACAEVAARHGVSKKELYDAVLAHRS